jgi:ADP-heptose:LPS heptosyltransferase
LRAFRKANPGVSITVVTQAAPFTRVLDGNPDIDLLVYSERMYLNGIPDERDQWISMLPIGLRETATLYTLDLRAVVTSSGAFEEHISKAFARIVGVRTDSVRPILVLDDLDRRAARVLAPNPYVVLSRHSVSNPERDDGAGGKKDWPSERWQELARRVQDEYDLEVFMIGSERDPFPAEPGVRPVCGLPIKIVAALLEGAECNVMVENGIGHLSAAVDAPMVEIYSRMMPLAWANPAEATACEVIYNDPHTTTVDEVLRAMERVFSRRGHRVPRCVSAS